MSDIEKIAAGLDKRQKKAIKSSDWNNVRGDDKVLEELAYLGITGEDDWIDQLTPLGLAVRAHLENSNAE